MKRDLDLDLLRSFAAVAETRNFTRAAERLGRVQSAISMQVKRLEDVVGAKLFHRTRRAVRLTPDGAVLLRHAQRMLRLNEQVLADFGRQAVGGRVRLGATDTSMCFLPAVLSRFAQSYPLIELEVRCDRSWEALDALEAGEVDLALVTQPCGRDGGQIVRRESLMWAVSQASVVDEQDPVPLAIFALGCIYRDAALKALQAMGRSWRHAYNSPSRGGLDVAVEAGLAVTIVPECALTPRLRVVGPEQGYPLLPAMEILLYGPAGAASAAVATLAEVIVETLAVPDPIGPERLDTPTCGRSLAG
ncbi:MAG: LysR substrate-binding domain-containing protein [Pseudomonadota bacterium]